MSSRQHTRLWGARDLEILKMLSEGKTQSEVAQILLRSESAVEARLGAMRKDMGCKTTVQLVAFAVRHSFI